MSKDLPKFNYSLTVHFDELQKLPMEIKSYLQTFQRVDNEFEKPRDCLETLQGEYINQALIRLCVAVKLASRVCVCNCKPSNSRTIIKYVRGQDSHSSKFESFQRQAYIRRGVGVLSLFSSYLQGHTEALAQQKFGIYSGLFISRSSKRLPI